MGSEQSPRESAAMKFAIGVIGSLLVCIVDVRATQACEWQGAGHPVVVAHRGSMFEHPENTLAAFAWAREVGAEVIEIDVRTSADGKAVVMHDKRVDRTTNGRGAVHRLTLAELQALTIGRDASIPTLDAALAFAADTRARLLLDLKETEPDVAQVAAAVSRHGLESDVIVGLNSLSAMTRLQQVHENLTTLAFAGDEETIGAFLAAGVDIVRVAPRSVTRRPRLVEKIRAAGACVWVTTGRLSGTRLERIMAQGIDGLISDFPQEALRLRAARSWR
jgi:glycerophosphoryl diester phosphodiesterase